MVKKKTSKKKQQDVIKEIGVALVLGLGSAGIVYFLTGKKPSDTKEEQTVETIGGGSYLSAGAGYNTADGIYTETPKILNIEYNFPEDKSVFPEEQEISSAEFSSFDDVKRSSSNSNSKKDKNVGGYTSELENIVNVGLKSNYLKNAPKEYADSFKETANKVKTGQVLTPKDIVNVGNVSAYIGKKASSTIPKKEETKKSEPVLKKNLTKTQQTLGKAYIGFTRLKKKISL